MNPEELNQLKQLKAEIDEILSLDINYLREKMKTDPEEILVVMRGGFIVLDNILEQALKEVDN